jgi:hypothetical protein
MFIYSHTFIDKCNKEKKSASSLMGFENKKSDALVGRV